MFNKFRRNPSLYNIPVSADDMKFDENEIDSIKEQKLDTRKTFTE